VAGCIHGFLLTLFSQTEPQIIPHEAEAREGAEAEQTYPSVDPFEDWKYHQVSTHHRSLPFMVLYHSVLPWLFVVLQNGVD